MLQDGVWEEQSSLITFSDAFGEIYCGFALVPRVRMWSWRSKGGGWKMWCLVTVRCKVIQQCEGSGEELLSVNTAHLRD